MRFHRRDLLAGATGVAGGAAGLEAAAHLLRPRSVADLRSFVSQRVEGGFRVVESNGLPGHEVGDFPNPHDPLPVRGQAHRLRMPAGPVALETPIPLGMDWFGVAVNGVPFDPSGPFWKGDTESGWQFEVLHPGNAIALGIDRNNAHTQIGGMYHYHGLPAGLLARLAAEAPAAPMTLVGWAADGFPVYGPECPADPTDLASPTRRLRSGYRLRAGPRRDGPPGTADGRFVEDHVFEEGFGDLDACNGRRGPTPEYPEGTYYYVLTDAFPFIPRFLRGQPDRSFAHGPPPGVAVPMPPELRSFGGVDEAVGAERGTVSAPHHRRGPPRGSRGPGEGIAVAGDRT